MNAVVKPLWPIINLEVHCWRDLDAPASHRWNCCLRDYDLGSKVFSGRWQREAIDELLDYYEQNDGSLSE